MARQIQLRRGTTAEHSTFTGAVGEVTVDTDKDVVVVHDGSTAGGVPLLKAADLAAGTGLTLTGTEFSVATTVVTSAYTGDVDITGELIVDSYNETFAAVTSTANAVTVNCEAGNSFSHTLTENTTFTFSNPPATGTSYAFTLKIVQDSTARTITWPASVDWPGATAPTLSTGSGNVDVFVFFTHDGGTNWYGFTAGQEMS